MNIHELREIDNIYKQVTNNQLTSKISVKDKITLIHIISGKKMRVSKPKMMQIPIITKTRTQNKNLPNWMYDKTKTNVSGGRKNE